MKEWIGYIEDGKTKVLELNHNWLEMSRLCQELGLTVLGCIADKTELGAKIYADHTLRKDVPNVKNGNKKGK